MITGDPANFVLLQFAKRKYRLRQRCRTDGMQKVALVLVPVRALEQVSFPVHQFGPRVMAGREEFSAQAFGMLTKHTELDFAIAQDVRVGCPSSGVLIEEILEDPVAILFGEVDMMQRYLELLADLAGVLEVFGSRAVAVLVFPVGHVQRLDLGPGLLQQDGRNSGIDAPGQPEDDLAIFGVRHHSRRILAFRPGRRSRVPHRRCAAGVTCPSTANPTGACPIRSRGCSAVRPVYASRCGAPRCPDGPSSAS